MIMSQRALAIAVAIASASFAHAQIDETRDDGSFATSRISTVQAPDSARLVIAEILFNPVEGDTAFVELLHVGQQPVQLTSFVLQLDTLVLPLPDLPVPLAPGARVVIRFDGRGTVEDNVVHAASGFELRTEGGTVSIRGNDDDVFDEIAWGDAPDAFVPTIGGLAMPGALERGSSFGRPPSANRAGAHSDWVVYAPHLVTPGQPNPLPPVSQLLPGHGAILTGTSTELMWYPVAGAVRYRVQLARDTTFAQTLLNDTVADMRINSGQLPAGVYWWRVQAIPADGAAAPWSRPSLLELASANGEDAAEDAAGGPLLSGDVRHANAGSVMLPVPLILQHKDTKMLHLESLQEGRQRTSGRMPNVPHAWDRDHGTLHTQDPVDNMNCMLASLAMINRYYGGDLSQDRIGFEGWGPNVAKYRATILSSAVIPTIMGSINPQQLQEARPGPEQDLHHSRGMPWGRWLAEALFALGTLPGANSTSTPPYGNSTTDSLWHNIKLEIDNRRPVFGMFIGHGSVIRGYELRGNRRLVHINDPWFGQYALDLDVSSRGPMAVPLYQIFTFPNVRARSQEAEVTKDTDGDGVVDFDETERFRTDPTRPDTDADGVPDRQDIASGVYEIGGQLGYAYNPTSNSRGRDYDADGKPTELDPDSDNGGCKDGEEDQNGDGEKAHAETWNFDPADDVCRDLEGHLSYLFEAINTAPPDIGRVMYDRGVILVKLKQESPGSQNYVDAGSTYSYQGYARTEVIFPHCTMWGRELARGTGSFTGGKGEMGAYRADNDTLTIGVTADVASRTSTGGCSAPAHSPGERTMNFPDCDGALPPRRAGQPPPSPHIYRFNCTTPPDVPPGWRVTQFYARGFIRVP